MGLSEQPAPHRQLVACLSSTWHALSELGAGLSEAQWKTATALPGWSVQDTLSHVIGIERLLEGLPAAEALPGDVPPYVHNPIGEFNEREVAARRTRSGAEVLAEWDELRARREATLAAADDEYFAQPMDTPTGPGTMTDFLGARVLDCWVHEQDIRTALGRCCDFSGPAAEYTVDRLARSLPVVVGKRAACPEGSAVSIEMTGPIRRRFVCEVIEGRAAFVESPSAPPAAAVTMDTECYLALATGRRSANQLAGEIAVSGDEDLVARVVGGLNVLF